MNLELTSITSPLSDALEPHLDRVNDAADFLRNNGPITQPVIASAFDGVAAAVVMCHGLAVYSGWWHDKEGQPIDANDKNVFGTKIALIHSEVSEAMEGGRKNKMDDHLPLRRADEVELADAVIRIFDLAGARHLDLAGAIIEKLAYNQQRADHKPEARNAPGGKAF